MLILLPIDSLQLIIIIFMQASQYELVYPIFSDYMFHTESIRVSLYFCPLVIVFKAGFLIFKLFPQLLNPVGPYEIELFMYISGGMINPIVVKA